jgi:hypothetical protein
MVEQTLHSTVTHGHLGRYLPQEHAVGLDLGQASDWTAMCILTKKVLPAETAMFSPVGESPSNRLVKGRVVLDLSYAKRTKDKNYTEIARDVVDRLVALAPGGEFGERGVIACAIDGTGVGRGVCDMFSTEIKRRDRRGEYTPEIDLRFVAFRSSQETLKRPDRTSGYWRVPLNDLVFPAVVSFQDRRIRIPKDVVDREQLIHELKHFRRKVNLASGSEGFEAWREKDHDDLVFALALAHFCWKVRRRPGAGRVRAFGADGREVRL